MNALGRAAFRAWCVVCVATLTVLIGARWLAYTRWAAVPAIAPFLRETMVIDQQAFLWPWVYTVAKLPVLAMAAAVLVVGLHRRLPAHVVARIDGRWRLRAVPMALLLGALLSVQYLLDVNPSVTVVCAASLAVVTLAERTRRTAALPAGASAVLWAALAVVGLILAGDAADRITVALWMALLAASHRFAGAIGGAELALVRILLVVPMNLLPAALPALLPLHGGTFVGDGLVYGFCEVPDRHAVYGSLPVCGSVQTSYERCGDGRVLEYDLATMQRTAAHAFFSPTFFGRLELLVCLDDEVEVAIQGLKYQGRGVVQGVLAFPIDAPERFKVLTSDHGIGATIAYDRAHDALFYCGEFDNPLVRYDRRTGAFDDAPSRDLARRWYEPIALTANGGSLIVHTTSIDAGRHRIYLADWMQGRYAYAVDSTSLRLVTRYDVGGGGALGIAVDAERNRLFVSSVWGLEVVDLGTGDVVARIRTGVGNRPVIVDAARNRLYLISTIEGKLRVLDRDTFAVLAKIPSGIGSRYALLTTDGTRLFASSIATHYYWNPDALVPAPSGASSP